MHGSLAWVLLREPHARVAHALYRDPGNPRCVITLERVLLRVDFGMGSLSG